MKSHFIICHQFNELPVGNQMMVTDVCNFGKIGLGVIKSFSPNLQLWSVCSEISSKRDKARVCLCSLWISDQHETQQTGRNLSVSIMMSRFMGTEDWKPSQGLSGK